MDASAYAFAHGVRHTRATLRAWQRQPLARASGAGSPARRSRPPACCVAVLGVASLDHGYEQVITLQPPFAVGGLGDVLRVLRSNLLVLALHAMACVAGFIAGSSLPLQAQHQRGLSRWVHEHGGRLAIALRVRRDGLLAERAGVRDRPRARRRLALPARLARRCCCWACCRTRSPS